MIPVRFTARESAALRQLALRHGTTASALAQDIICRELFRSGMLAPPLVEGPEKQQAHTAAPPEASETEPTADTTAAGIETRSPEADPVQPDIERHMTAAEIQAENELHASVDAGM